jgi:hypothetical protein
LNTSKAWTDQRIIQELVFVQQDGSRRLRLGLTACGTVGVAPKRPAPREMVSAA